MFRKFTITGRTVTNNPTGGMYMHYVSFPGLGIESFGLKQSAFTLFGVDIMWYGILITAGMILLRTHKSKD